MNKTLTIAALLLLAACSDGASVPTSTEPTVAGAAVLPAPSKAPESSARAAIVPGNAAPPLDLLPTPHTTAPMVGPQSVLVMNGTTQPVPVTRPATVLVAKESLVTSSTSSVFGPWDVSAYGRVRVTFASTCPGVIVQPLDPGLAAPSTSPAGTLWAPVPNTMTGYGASGSAMLEVPGSQIALSVQLPTTTCSPNNAILYAVYGSV
jgi:hypothetical protein